MRCWCRGANHKPVACARIIVLYDDARKIAKCGAGGERRRRIWPRLAQGRSHLLARVVQVGAIRLYRMREHRRPFINDKPGGLVFVRWVREAADASRCGVIIVCMPSN